MFAAIRSTIDNDFDYYELIGTFDELDDAKRHVRDYVDNDLVGDFGMQDYDTCETDKDELFYTVFNEDGNERSHCVRYMIFDTNKPMSFVF